MSQLRTERLRTLITEDILSLRLQPGERLEECGLAEKYGTSRTPVREALRQLSSDGLVEIRPKKRGNRRQIQYSRARRTL